MMMKKKEEEEEEEEEEKKRRRERRKKKKKREREKKKKKKKKKKRDRKIKKKIEEREKKDQKIRIFFVLGKKTLTIRITDSANELSDLNDEITKILVSWLKLREVVGWPHIWGEVRQVLVHESSVGCFDVILGIRVEASFSSVCRQRRRKNKKKEYG